MTDLIISPSSEKYLTYSTHSGVLHYIGTFIDMLLISDHIIDINQLKEGTLHQHKIDLPLLAPELFAEVSSEQESRCVLMKKQGIFSLGIFPSNENQIWCA